MRGKNAINIKNPIAIEIFPIEEAWKIMCGTLKSDQDSLLAFIYDVHMSKARII